MEVRIKVWIIWVCGNAYHWYPLKSFKILQLVLISVVICYVLFWLSHRLLQVPCLPPARTFKSASTILCHSLSPHSHHVRCWWYSLKVLQNLSMPMGLSWTLGRYFRLSPAWPHQPLKPHRRLLSPSARPTWDSSHFSSLQPLAFPCAHPVPTLKTALDLLIHQENF